MAASPYAGPDSDLEPNVNDIASFLSWWFKFCTRGQIEIGWLDVGGRGLIHFLRFDLDSQEIVPSIVTANLVPGQAMYFRASTVRPRTSGFTADEDFVQAPGVWGDIDTPEQMEQAKAVDTKVRPNGSVITGRIPDLRAQSFFRASAPVVNPGLVRSLNRGIYRLYGGDPAVVNPTRLMRLPGTIAWPWKAGRIPELTSFVQNSERPVSYLLSELTSQLPQEEAAGVSQAAPQAPGMLATLNNVSEMIRLTQTGQQWHNNMIRLVAHWLGRSWSNAEILIACEALTLPGYTHEQTRDDVLKAIDGGRKRWNIPEEDHEVGDGESGPLTFEATSLRDLDLDNIPPRRWIYGRELVRGYVSVLASPGGVGKTAYTLAVGVSVALKQSLLSTTLMGAPPLHCTVHKAGNVWFYNLEDPIDEMRRRVKATLDHHRKSKASVENHIYIDSGRDRPLVIAIRTVKGDLIAAPLVPALVAELKRREITLLIVDPFVQSHSAEENRNEEMNLVMALWGQVAKEADCAVWLVHHFRKGGKGGDVESVRGAGAIQGAARSMFNISSMVAEEADKLGVPSDQFWQYIRHDNVKQNMAPPATNAVWYKLVGIELGNGTEEYPEGDFVQAVESWVPPTPWGDMPWSLIERILNLIDGGLGGGEFYAFGKQSQERWAGKVIVHEAGKTDGQASVILKDWKANGVFEDKEYASPHQKSMTKCIRINQAKVAEMRRDCAMRDDPVSE